LGILQAADLSAAADGKPSARMGLFKPFLLAPVQHIDAGQAVLTVPIARHCGRPKNASTFGSKFDLWDNHDTLY
jgi:hypothetical protein